MTLTVMFSITLTGGVWIVFCETFFPPFCIIYIGTQSYLSQKSFEALQSHGRVLSTLSRKQEQSINNGQQCSEEDIANITNQLKI